MIINVKDAVIADSKAMDILAKVTDNMLRFTKGRFAMNHPRFMPCSFKLLPVIGQESRAGKMFFHSFHKLCTKAETQLNDGVKIFAITGGVFHFAFKGTPQGRNDAVYVRMKAQVLSPGMQYADGTALHGVMTVAE
jgi:hypothetical protein